MMKVVHSWVPQSRPTPSRRWYLPRPRHEMTIVPSKVTVEVDGLRNQRDRVALQMGIDELFIVIGHIELGRLVVSRSQTGVVETSISSPFSP